MISWSFYLRDAQAAPDFTVDEKYEQQSMAIFATYCGYIEL